MGGGSAGAGASTCAASHTRQHMYFLEGGLLVATNLLKTDQWVQDEERTHCNVCVQQFLPFRRGHHCRTCGEVVCSGCSSHRKIHLTDVNVECSTRVCTFCSIRATDASIQVNEAATRETLNVARRSTHVAVSGRRKHMSMMSMESELTEGSVVQLWPNPIPENESARLEIVRNSTIMTTENDPTLNLLVGIVARTLECPVAFVGILDDQNLLLKASIGWNRTSIPREDGICTRTMLEEKTMIVPDTNMDKHFVATTLGIHGKAMRFYAGAPITVLGQCIGTICALDVVPHKETSAPMKSTLEAIANIVSEVLEQRVDSKTQAKKDAYGEFKMKGELLSSENERVSRSSDSGSDSTLTDPHISQRSMNVLDCLSYGRPSTLDSNGRDTSICMVLPAIPPEYSDKICTAINSFQYLLSSSWKELQSDGDIRGFECVKAHRHFSRSSMKIAADCTEVINQLLNYDDKRLYEQLFARVTRKYQLNKQTWMDEISFQPDVMGSEGSDVRVLSHWRQYPDGSNIVIAARASRLYEVDERDLLFGWFIGPSSSDKNAISVSSILSLPLENQSHDSSPTVQLMTRLKSVFPGEVSRPRGISLPSSVASSETTTDNQSNHDSSSSVIDLKGSLSDCGYSSRALVQTATQNAVAIRSNPQGVSHLNQNERMMLDLLDKTISTQEVLAAQQHMMASVMGYHGAQLQRISSAIQRVENMLSENGSKLKQTIQKSDSVQAPMRHSLS